MDQQKLVKRLDTGRYKDWDAPSDCASVMAAFLNVSLQDNTFASCLEAFKARRGGWDLQVIQGAICDQAPAWTGNCVRIYLPVEGDGHVEFWQDAEVFATRAAGLTLHTVVAPGVGWLTCKAWDYTDDQLLRSINSRGNVEFNVKQEQGRDWISLRRGVECLQYAMFVFLTACSAVDRYISIAGNLVSFSNKTGEMDFETLRGSYTRAAQEKLPCQDSGFLKAMLLAANPTLENSLRAMYLIAGREWTGEKKTSKGKTSYIYWRGICVDAATLADCQALKIQDRVREAIDETVKFMITKSGDVYHAWCVLPHEWYVDVRTGLLARNREDIDDLTLVRALQENHGVRGVEKKLKALRDATLLSGQTLDVREARALGLMCGNAPFTVYEHEAEGFVLKTDYKDGNVLLRRRANWLTGTAVESFKTAFPKAITNKDFKDFLNLIEIPEVKVVPVQTMGAADRIRQAVSESSVASQQPTATMTSQAPLASVIQLCEDSQPITTLKVLASNVWRYSNGRVTHAALGLKLGPEFGHWFRQQFDNFDKAQEKAKPYCHPGLRMIADYHLTLACALATKNKGEELAMVGSKFTKEGEILSRNGFTGRIRAYRPELNAYDIVYNLDNEERAKENFGNLIIEKIAISETVLPEGDVVISIDSAYYPGVIEAIIAYLKKRAAEGKKGRVYIAYNFAELRLSRRGKMTAPFFDGEGAVHVNLPRQEDWTPGQVNAYNWPWESKEQWPKLDILHVATGNDTCHYKHRYFPLKPVTQIWAGLAWKVRSQVRTGPYSSHVLMEAFNCEVASPENMTSEWFLEQKRGNVEATDYMLTASYTAQTSDSIQHELGVAGVISYAQYEAKKTNARPVISAARQQDIKNAFELHRDYVQSLDECAKAETEDKDFTPKNRSYWFELVVALIAIAWYRPFYLCYFALAALTFKTVEVLLEKRKHQKQKRSSARVHGRDIVQPLGRETRGMSNVSRTRFTFTGPNNKFVGKLYDTAGKVVSTVKDLVDQLPVEFHWRHPLTHVGLKAWKCADETTKPVVYQGTAATTIWAFFERHVAPRAEPNKDLLRRYRKWASSWTSSVATKIIAAAKRYSFEDYCNHAEPAKRTLYKRGWVENHLGKLKMKLGVMPKTFELQTTLERQTGDHFEDTKPRNLFNPHRTLLAAPGYFAWSVLQATIRAMKPSGFTVGSNFDELQDAMQKSRMKFNTPVFVTYDGSRHDSVQHASLIRTIDLALCSRLLKHAGRFGTWREDVLRLVRKAIMAIDFTVEALYRTSKAVKATMFRGQLKGTVMSGHPMRTTWGNTLRVMSYIDFALTEMVKEVSLISGEIDEPIEYDKYVAGDDTCIVTDKRFVRRIEAALNLVYVKNIDQAGGLGIVMKAFAVNEHVGDFLSKTIVANNNQDVRVLPKPGRFENRGHYTFKITKQLTIKRYRQAIYEMKHKGPIVTGKQIGRAHV